MATLKGLRTGAKLTQKELAMRVGVSERIIIFWEMGTVLPSFEALTKLYEVLGPEVHGAFAASRPHKKRGRKPKAEQEQPS